MKKFWLVLLSLGLVMAFSASAFAVDVKFSGEIYEAGMYLDKTSLQKDTATTGPSTAIWYQRLRVRTDFVVAPGVSVVTRFDAMERAWGAARSAPSAIMADTGGAGSSMSAGTVAENENIAFDWAYIRYQSPIGEFRVGWQDDGPWGTVFGDTSYVNARVLWLDTYGPLLVLAGIVQLSDTSYTAKNPLNQSDTDNIKYALGAAYMGKWGSAGLLVGWWRYASFRTTNEATSGVGSFWGALPYAIVQIGPVKIQAEIDYVNGKYPQYDSASGKDISVSDLEGWIDATVTLGPVYFGGTFAYVAGDDPSTTDKMEGGLLSGGRDWDPCLILWNYGDRYKWLGTLAGNGGSSNTFGVANAWFYQGRVGVKPIAKLDIMAAFTYATADQNPVAVGWVSKNYGYELDVTATYKITNNLSYMVGAGYLWAGDYFKGTNAASSVQNDYLLINKLTLTF
jgi:hypothetical protein